MSLASRVDLAGACACAVAVIAVAVAAGGCTGFRAADGPLDAAADLAPAGPPPDFECAEPWTATQRSDPRCAVRQVIFVETVTAPNAVSLARTGEGHVGICYDTQAAPSMTEVHVSQFRDTAPVPNAVVFTDTKFVDMGPASALAADADTLHVAFLGSVPGGQAIGYRQILPSGFSSSVEQPVAGLTEGAELALAAASDGVQLAYYDRGARRVTVRRRVGGVWSGETVVDPELAPALPGAGQVRLALDGEARPHLVVFHVFDAGRAQPRAAAWDGQAWSAPRVLDGATPEVAGFSVAVALLGGVGYASYFAAPAAGAPAELRLARWQRETEPPAVSVLAGAVPSDASAPQHRAALAVDRWGLVHIAVLIPASPGFGKLEYRRQTPANPDPAWLIDVVDDAAVTQGAPSFVDLTVDEQGRPHIGYYNGRGTVSYATRFDR